MFTNYRVVAKYTNPTEFAVGYGTVCSTEEEALAKKRQYLQHVNVSEVIIEKLTYGY
jgi:hypothetical protein